MRRADLEHRGEHDVRIALALGRRPNDAGENLLTVGAAQERFPPQTLRVTTAGRIACSARQFVASIVGSNKNDQTAVNSRWRCAAKRWTSGTRLGRSRRSARRVMSCHRTTASPCAETTPLVAVADVERLLQDHLHVGGEGGVRVISGDQSTRRRRWARQV